MHPTALPDADDGIPREPDDSVEVPAPVAPPHRAWRVAARGAAALVGAFAFLSAEGVAVGVLRHDELTGPWELRVALTHIVPVAFIASVPLVLASALVARLIEAAGRRDARAAVAVIAAAIGAVVAWGVSFGRHFDQLGVRVAFIAIVSMVAFALAWLTAPAVARLRLRAAGWSLAGWAFVVLAAEVANALVLPRLYPAFHLALAAVAVAVSAWFGDLLWKHFSYRPLCAAAAVLLAAAGLATPFAVRDLPRWDNLRVVYVTHAPVLAHALELAARLAPAQPSDAGSGMGPPAVAHDDPRWLDWIGRDIVLISIDAVRADHVGAYGYGRKTTPQLDAIAKEGVVFERAYSVMPHTSYSMTSLLTGKYIRPLLMQDTGHDSDTMAGLLRLYGYRTAAFYPPSLFAVDGERFEWAKRSGLGFEYRKLEYAKAPLRLEQSIRYLKSAPADHPLFLWVHFFEPHEPYDPPAAFSFGEREIDRYDGEIATADDALGALVREVRARRPNAVVIITADHGESFGDHGTYYHGTTVYEEQVRVPLILSAKDLEPRRVEQPVQLIDILPTVLHALDIPRRPRLRGNDLGAWIVGKGTGSGQAYAETHTQTLFAEGSWRLVCHRKIDACALYDLTEDPSEVRDVSANHPDVFASMRRRMKEVEDSHGAFELAGARLEGKSLPPALVRAMAGDGDAALDVAGLLEDADVVLRRRAARVLFELRRKEAAPALSLAVARDEDLEVRRWCACALARLGHGVPLAAELLKSDDVTWRRLAALALAESGDARGEAILVAWWNEGIPVERAKEVAGAFAKIHSTLAVVPMTRSLDSEQLRPALAASLAEIGDPYGRIMLLRHFSGERYVHARVAIAEALVKMGATRELAPSLARFLGVPDPLDGGVRIALQAGITDALGGPGADALPRVRAAGLEGALLHVVIPKGGNGRGYRLILRAKSESDEPSTVRFGAPLYGPGRRVKGSSVPPIDPGGSVTLDVQPGDWRETPLDLPEALRVAGGKPLEIVIVPGQHARVDAFVIVPRADEIPPPAPAPWRADAGVFETRDGEPDAEP